MSRLILLVLLSGCDRSGKDPVLPEPDTDVPVDTAVPRPTHPWDQLVEVRFDGSPIAGAIVMQGGALEHHLSDADGRATVRIDPAIEGDLIALAALTDARSVGRDLNGPTDLVVLDLEPLPAVDNADYVFQDPGTPTRNDSTAYCSHCHVRQVEDWVDHPHARAASNPVVHDVYAGTADLDEAACAAVGGTRATTRRPGGGTHETCVVGDGTLPDLNPACGAPCDTPASTGACADCHAPGIDGDLGGRDLLEAAGLAFDHGVHCDVCHKVQSVDLSAPAGVAGALQLLRPPADPTSFDGWEPLNFAPIPDVLNPRMGAVFSPLHAEARFCAGCHELDQAALVPGTTVDTDRWPEGTFPVHSTFREWEAGPLADVAPCQACHMPPDAEAGNAADIDLITAPVAGRAGGWWRPAGAARRHIWTGPRSDEADMLALAVTLELDTTVTDGLVHATTRVRQTGAGHAVPTGEPLRSLVLTVSASCDGTDVPAADGPAVPGFVGAVDQRDAGEDWTRWPTAAPGDLLRVVRDEGWVDYDGFGPFTDRFEPAAKGLPDLRVVGSAEVLGVDPDGTVTLSAPLPSGDRVFLGRAAAAEAAPLAGAAGFAFARVLADAEGRTMVPHHRAVDVVVDNRLLPGADWQTTHTFDAACAPTVTARLTYRAYPWALAAERGWSNPDRVVAEVSR
jgi:putative hemolysin